MDKLINKMKEEFIKYNGLTRETYDEVLQTGDEGLIAALSDSKSFIINLANNTLK